MCLLSAGPDKLLAFCTSPNLNKVFIIVIIITHHQASSIISSPRVFFPFLRFPCLRSHSHSSSYLSSIPFQYSQHLLNRFYILFTLRSDKTVFMCSIERCGKLSGDKRSLPSQIRIHETGRLSCLACPRSYSRKNNRNIHYKNKYGATSTSLVSLTTLPSVSPPVKPLSFRWNPIPCPTRSLPLLHLCLLSFWWLTNTHPPFRSSLP